jgi:hypothetical protein
MATARRDHSSTANAPLRNKKAMTTATARVIAIVRKLASTY